MEIPIVIYDQEMNRQEIGRVDVYAHNWSTFPADLQFDLDRAVIEGKVELVFNRIPGATIQRSMTWDEAMVELGGDDGETKET